MSPPREVTALRLTGRDVLPLLHRISTNALADLEEGELRPTLFCDFRGRLLHRALVGRAAGAIWLLRDDAPGSSLASFVDKHVFREEVAIEDRSGGHAPGTRVEGLPWPAVPDEAARIAAGLPRHGHEIAEEFNPYEVNLAAEVHLDKGCYTGQEALQRLVTYDSVRRRLVGLEGAGDVPGVPQDVFAAGASVGRLTSATARPGGGWVALAVVRRDAEGALELAGGGRAGEPRAFAEARPLGRA